MPKLIIDEFTDLPVSRQRKFQMRRARDGKCIVCAKPRVTANHCEACAKIATKATNASLRRTGYLKRWRKKNAKHIKALQRDYYLRRHDELRAYWKAWYARNHLSVLRKAKNKKRAARESEFRAGALRWAALKLSEMKT